MGENDEQERLRSGRAVAAGLMLAAVVLAAFAIFLLVLFGRSCAASRALRNPAISSPRAALFNIIRPHETTVCS
jgi:hypothetical protein